MSKSYRVTWSKKIKARSMNEARSKARLIVSPPVLCVEEVIPLPAEPDSKTHCPHGLLWTTSCERC